jgi:hypothetical protein
VPTPAPSTHPSAAPFFPHTLLSKARPPFFSPPSTPGCRLGIPRSPPIPFGRPRSAQKPALLFFLRPRNGAGAKRGPRWGRKPSATRTECARVCRRPPPPYPHPLFPPSRSTSSLSTLWKPSRFGRSPRALSFSVFQKKRERGSGADPRQDEKKRGRRPPAPSPLFSSEVCVPPAPPFPCVCPDPLLSPDPYRPPPSQEACAALSFRRGRAPPHLLFLLPLGAWATQAARHSPAPHTTPPQHRPPFTPCPLLLF